MTPRCALWLATFAIALAVTVRPGDAQSRFPVRPSPDGRVVVDASGRPFPILGRTAWFMAMLSTADVDVFLQDTLARGFNAVELAMIGHDPRGRHVPFDDGGAAPFLKRLDGRPWQGGLKYGDAAAEAPDFTTPNEAYWRRLDALLADLESRGLLAFVFPAYVGYAGNTNQGWMGEMVVNGPERMRLYGEFVARRYAGRNNLVWMLGGDFGEFDAAQGAAERGLIDGLMRGDLRRAPKLRSAEWSSETIGTDQPEFGPLITLNGAYTFDGYTADHARRAYAVAPARPAFLLEEPVRRRSRRRHQRQPPRDPAGAAVPVVGLARIDRRLHGRQRLRVAVRRRHVAVAPRHARVARSRPPECVHSRDRVAHAGAIWPRRDARADHPRRILRAGSRLHRRRRRTRRQPPGGLRAPGRRRLVRRRPARDARPGPGPVVDPTAGTWQPAADALPNTAPHTVRLPGRNAATERDWVLVLDAPATAR